MNALNCDWLSVNRKPTFILLFPALLIAILGCLLITTGCHRSVKHDSRLVKIAGAISENPELALDSLKSINRDGLSEADRYFHEFLTIKASDKAYIEHTSDKPVLDVIGYMEKHPEEDLYGEALYYGGRVYSDLGDYPQALDYFYRSIDILKEQPDQLSLLGTVQSQTGRLLNTLRLYKQAIPFLEASTETSRILNDTIGEVYDLQLLGFIHTCAKNYMMADHYLSLARDKSKLLDKAIYAKSCVYLADVKYKTGRLDSALFYIRDTPEMVRPLVRNIALAIAVDIYNAVGIQDTACMYAHQLIKSPYVSNKQTGYAYLLSSPNSDSLPIDTIAQYTADYLRLLENYYDENSNQMAISQLSLYNYRSHEQAHLQAENKNMMLLKIIGVCLIVILGLLSFILFSKIKKKNKELELQTTLIQVYEKEEVISKKESFDMDCDGRELSDKSNDAGASDEITHLETLRAQIQRKVLDLYERQKNNIHVSPIILESSAYQRLRELINKKMVLTSNNKLWKELERIVIESSPQFKMTLLHLVGGKFSSFDWETCLLIKCGITSSELGTLLSKTKGTIVSRRESIAMRMFGEKMNYRTLQDIILLL